MKKIQHEAKFSKWKAKIDRPMLLNDAAETRKLRERLTNKKNNNTR